MKKDLKLLPFSVFLLGPTPGQSMVLPKPNDCIGFVFYQANQNWGYDAFGGTGPGDALRIVDGRGHWAGLRSAPDFGASPYDLKTNPKPTMVTFAFVNDAARFWANTEQVGFAAADDAARKYKNPYDINMKATEDTLFFGALTPAFKPYMITDIYESIKAAVIDAGLEYPTPKVFINESNNETSIVVI